MAAILNLALFSIGVLELGLMVVVMTGITGISGWFLYRTLKSGNKD
jgi:uncharacterized membrane protein